MSFRIVLAASLALISGATRPSAFNASQAGTNSSAVKWVYLATNLQVDANVDSEIHEYPTLPGDIYLLCSDGLSDMVEDEDIGLTLQTLGANLNLAAQQLVQMANDNGGRDNVSVILVRVREPYPAPRGFLAKLAAWFR